MRGRGASLCHLVTLSPLHLVILPLVIPARVNSAMPALLTGVINLDKPAGLSSARVVDRVKRLLPRGTKIGHAGTLDPFATGVLLLLVGKATKSCEMLMGQRKGYEALMKLGGRTVTDDPESPEESVEVSTPPSGGQVREAAGRFVGNIQQRPPAFSAMKVGGQRAYKLARQGEVVE